MIKDMIKMLFGGTSRLFYNEVIFPYIQQALGSKSANILTGYIGFSSGDIVMISNKHESVDSIFNDMVRRG